MTHILIQQVLIQPSASQKPFRLPTGRKGSFPSVASLDSHVFVCLFHSLVIILTHIHNLFFQSKGA